MTRIRLDQLNLTLKGYPREEAQRLADRLPRAIAHALDHPNAARPGLLGQVARQVADGLRQHPGKER